MRKDKTKSILSIIATIISIVLILIYWLAPADETSHPLYVLFIDCIPDSLVVLIAMPIVYWLLYRRGLTNMGDCPLFVTHSGATSHHHHHLVNPTQRKQVKTSDEQYSQDELDVLFVLGVEDINLKDSQIDGVITPLNATIRMAEAGEMLVVFLDCCGFSGLQSSSKGNRVDLFQALYQPDGSFFSDFKMPSDNAAKSVLTNSAVDMVVSNPRVCTVYIAGIGNECCMKAISRSAIQHGKKAIALDNTIIMASDNAEQVWKDLVAEGLLRQEYLSANDPD